MAALLTRILSGKAVGLFKQWEFFVLCETERKKFEAKKMREICPELRQGLGNVGLDVTPKLGSLNCTGNYTIDFWLDSRSIASRFHHLSDILPAGDMKKTEEFFGPLFDMILSFIEDTMKPNNKV